MVMSGHLYVDPESLNLEVERGHTVFQMESFDTHFGH